jgi:hypothetical protein
MKNEPSENNNLENQVEDPVVKEPDSNSGQGFEASIENQHSSTSKIAKPGGPRTEEGKRRSSRNATKHSFYSSHLSLRAFGPRNPMKNTSGYDRNGLERRGRVYQWRVRDRPSV